MTEPTHIKLIKSHDEAGNVRTFIFETGGLSWTAGQYQTYVLPQAGATEELNKHFFTIASAPSEGVIQISTRLTGSAFKNALDALNPGDTIERRHIEGDFIWEDEPSDPVVFVAGGIGVTPFRSILIQRAADNKQINATLLFYNRDNDIPFREEFEQLSKKHPEFTFKPIIGEAISAETIIKNADPGEKLIYISGAEIMVEVVGEDLKKRGYHVKQDWFPGYDDKSY